ncbi:branched-chain amino acid ABC transporter substrate-binding protein [Streptomyces sp. NPDC002104]
MDVTIGCVAPLTGEATHLGRDLIDGARLAVEQANAGGRSLAGQSVRFVLRPEDDRGESDTAVEVAKKLAGMRVAGVVGHLHSGTALTASKTYQDAGIAYLTTATSPRLTQQGFDHVFCVVTDDVRIGTALAEYAANTLKVRTVATIGDGTAYSQGLVSSFTQAARRFGLGVVSSQFGTEQETDFTRILTAIKSKNPELLFVGALDATAGLVIRQMRNLGIEAHVMGGDGICTTLLPVFAGGQLADGRVHAITSGAGVAPADPFRSAFEGKFRHPVALSAPYAYDAVNALIAAMVKAGSPNPAVYTPQLARLTHIGVTGIIAFDNRGNLRNDAVRLSTSTGNTLVAVT